MSVELKDIKMKEMELLGMMGITQPSSYGVEEKDAEKDQDTVGMCEQKRGTGQSGHFELLAWRRRERKG